MDYFINKTEPEGKMIFKGKDFSSAITKRNSIEDRFSDLWAKIATCADVLIEAAKEINDLQKEIESSPLVIDGGVQ